jgi:hypothetical protein
MKHHSFLIRILTPIPLAGRGTVLAGQFDWGGFLPKSNGGVRSSAQHGWQPCVEDMAKSRVYCETYKSSSCESRPK